MQHCAAQPKVLFVDDSWYMHCVVQEVLETGGYEVLHAGDGAEAVDMYGQLRPDLVLMDIILPQLDGFTAISQIRAIDPQARIVVVTGLADDSARARAVEAGAVGFVTKPISLGDFMGAVRSALLAA